MTAHRVPSEASTNNGKWLKTVSGAWTWANIASGDVSGLGTAAAKNTGTTAGTVATGDDSRITGAAQKSANLSDLAAASTARTNLGLGGAAILNVGTSAGTVAAGDDGRFGAGGLTAVGIPSGKVPKSDGANNWSWLDDLTGASPGAIAASNLTQDVRNRLEKTSISTLDGTANGYWTTPDTGVFDVTGTIDLRMFCLPDAWVSSLGQSLVAKWNAAGNQRSWRFLIGPTGILETTTSTAGVTSILAAGTKLMQQNAPPSTPVWLRAVIDPTGGASGHVLSSFYYTTVISPASSDWILLEQITAASGGATFSGSARVMIGNDDSSGGNQSFFKGKIYRAEIRDGSGTLIEDFDAGALAVGGTTYTGTNGHVWTAGSSNVTSLANIDMASLQSLNAWIDTTVYGAKCDLRRITTPSVTSGSPIVTGAFNGNNADAGKLVVCVGAGTVVVTNTNGSMDSGAANGGKNILTGSGFTSDCLGRFVSVTGVGTAGATKTGRVIGIVDSTHVRLNFIAITTASSQTYTISDNLYATSTASTTTTLTLDTNASVTLTPDEIWLATDDAPAIQAAINAGESLGTNGYTLYHRGPSGIGTGLLMQKPCLFQGHGSPGYSNTLGHGTVRIRPMKPQLVALTMGSATTGLGVRGTITQPGGGGTALHVTDPDANFLVGDVGHAFYCRGGATQTGSDTQAWLETTIASRVSATEVTLAATAGTLVSDALYTYGAGAGFAFASGRIDGIHIEGFPDQKCGFHLMNGGGGLYSNFTVSDYPSGWGIVSDRGTGFNANLVFHNMNIVDCYGHMASFGGILVFSGQVNIDGNSNRVDCYGGNGTIGLAFQNTTLTTDSLNIQAVETWGAFGGSSHLMMNGCRSECVAEGLIVTTDGVNGNKGSQIRFVSWSNSSMGKQGKGFVWGSGLTHIFVQPGYYLTSDTDMYGNCDATSLVNTIRLDQYLDQTYAASNVTPDRTYDANSTTLDEVADVLGTLIADLRTQGVVK